MVPMQDVTGGWLASNFTVVSSQISTMPLAQHLPPASMSIATASHETWEEAERKQTRNNLNLNREKLLRPQFRTP